MWRLVGNGGWPKVGVNIGALLHCLSCKKDSAEWGQFGTGAD